MVYEEEDFQPMQYGYHLNPDISDQRIIGMLREVEEDYQKRTRAKELKVSDKYSGCLTLTIKLFPPL